MTDGDWAAEAYRQGRREARQRVPAIGPDGECLCVTCETIRTYGWRALPRPAFFTGLAVGFGGAVLGVVLALVLIGWFG